MEAFQAQLGDGGQEEFRAERMEVMSVSCRLLDVDLN